MYTVTISVPKEPSVTFFTLKIDVALKNECWCRYPVPSHHSCGSRLEATTGDSLSYCRLWSLALAKAHEWERAASKTHSYSAAYFKSEAHRRHITRSYTRLRSIKWRV